MSGLHVESVLCEALVRDSKGLSCALPLGDAPRYGPALIASVRIPARPLDDEASGQILFLKPDQVAYFFRGNAVEQRLIQPIWSPRPSAFFPDRIYIRTTKGEVYQAVHRSLTAVFRQFGEPLFPIHQSLLVNLNALHNAYLRPLDPQVGMRVALKIEYLNVARRRVPALKRRLM